MKAMQQPEKSGFTLIELLVVIAIIGILASVVLASLSQARNKAKDAKRISDMKQIQTALELYYNDNGRYPPPVSGNGSWEESNEDNGAFLTDLVTRGYLPDEIVDPVNDANFRYAYYRYSPSNGCTAPFYVLGIRRLESSGSASVAYNSPLSPGWQCPSRDWNVEFQWVTGKFE